MINQLFGRKERKNGALSLSQIEELFKTYCNKIADDVAEKLKHELTARPNDSSDQTDTPDCITPRIQLNPREKIIVKLIAHGKSNKEISAEIYLSEGGVKNSVTRLFDKLGVESRAQLIVYAIVNKLLSEEELAIYNNKKDNCSTKE